MMASAAGPAGKLSPQTAWRKRPPSLIAESSQPWAKQRDGRVEAAFELGNLGQSAQFHVLLHGGHDGPAAASDDRGSDLERLVRLERKRRVGDQLVLEAPGLRRPGRSAPSHGPRNGRSGRANRRPRPPCPRAPRSGRRNGLLGDGHQRKRDLDRIGHPADMLGRRDIRLAAARLVVKVLQTGQKPLGLAPPKVPKPGKSVSQGRWMTSRSRSTANSVSTRSCPAGVPARETPCHLPSPIVAVRQDRPADDLAGRSPIAGEVRLLQWEPLRLVVEDHADQFRLVPGGHLGARDLDDEVAPAASVVLQCQFRRS